MLESEVLNSTFANDSFHFLSVETMHRNHSSSFANQEETPLEYLQTKNESLMREMKRSIRKHKATMETGEDSSHLRLVISHCFNQLSENCLFLNEVYGKEHEFAENLLDNFEKWDKKRSKVLRRIQSIKSENNKYGTKLASLLGKRGDIDAEIESLEARIQSLKNSRIAISFEIKETSSVLESKSAKYVNIFRDLERKGRDAIADYLYFSGMPEHNMELLLKSEPVEAGFAYTSMYDDGKNRSAAKELSPNGTPSGPPMSASKMGMQALEVPPEALEVPPLKAESAYEKGYAKGSEQFGMVKQKLNLLVQTLVTHKGAKPRPSPSGVDDALNTITEKIDLVPIVELLSYKMEALEDLMVKTSKMSAAFHDDSLKWKDTMVFIESQENSLYKSLLESQATSVAVETLKSSYNYLSQQMQSVSLSQRGQHDFLNVILHQELKIVAVALDQLLKTSTYTDSLLLPDASILEKSGLFNGTIPNLSMRITSTGYQPTNIPTVSTAKAGSTLGKTRDRHYTASSKEMKEE